MTKFATPRMNIVWQVLEAAKDAGDIEVMAACRRLIRADTIGWRAHANAEDAALVWEFA